MVKVIQNTIQSFYQNFVSECAFTMFTCDNLECVNGTSRCDGVTDCSDGTDEAGCITTTTVSTGRSSFSFNSLMTLKKKALENTVGKGEIAANQHFLLFLQCFLLYQREKSSFYQCLICRLQILSI